MAKIVSGIDEPVSRHVEPRFQGVVQRHQAPGIAMDRADRPDPAATPENGEFVGFDHVAQGRGAAAA
jgi:hypothetical protein